ncbi:zeta toxin family protein [Caproiciproducens sp.]|uniref:zeta toxin family protein n=1 Tax=Caproiciproducens sp. TaxID=1954376 RepID=UPI0028A20EA6|nr:zeta toxin family protein [Caproiciproducens sp.]
MKVYTIVGGVNGAGKSSLTGVLKAERNDLGYIIDVDKIAFENQGDNYKAARIAISKIEKFMKNGITFTQETTLSGHMVERTIKKAKDLDYAIHLFYVGLSSVEESLKRIKNRVEKGGHDIPTDDVIRRYDNRFETLIKILPYCDEVKFYDNENRFDNVAEYRNGEIIYKSDYKPDWLIGLQEQLDEEENIIISPEMEL